MSDNKSVRNMKKQMANILTGGGPLEGLVEYDDSLDDLITEDTKVKIVDEGFKGSSFATLESKQMHPGERGVVVSGPVKQFGDEEFDEAHYFILIEGQSLPYLISEDEFYEFDWR